MTTKTVATAPQSTPKTLDRDALKSVVGGGGAVYHPRPIGGGGGVSANNG